MFEKIKKFYKQGLYTKKQLRMFCERCVITEEQYNEILKS